MWKIFLPPKKDTSNNVFLVDVLSKGKPQGFASMFGSLADLNFDIVLTSDWAQADLLLLPQPVIRNDLSTSEYIKGIMGIYGKERIPKLLFIGGDLSHLVNVQDFYNLKGTQYKRYQKENEIIIPSFCEDLGKNYGVIYRHKTDGAVVSFCGWAGFDTRFRLLKYLVKNLLIDIKKIMMLDPSLEVFKKGLYFRRKSIRSLLKNKKVKTNFIIRRTFSGNASTIELSPEQARAEYVQNMINSDFVLAPKGDANYSVRFFESLSLGRIPILIDTECCLPLEDTIDYSKCILRVSYKDIPRLGDIVAEFWEKLSDSDYVAMQKEARRVFETYLRYDSFFNTVLPRVAANYTRNH